MATCPVCGEDLGVGARDTWRGGSSANSGLSFRTYQCRRCKAALWQTGTGKALFASLCAMAGLLIFMVDHLYKRGTGASFFSPLGEIVFDILLVLLMALASFFAMQIRFPLVPIPGTRQPPLSVSNDEGKDQ